MASLPTVVLVHGAWHTPRHYETYIKALQTRGFTVHCPHLPSCNGSSPPNASFSDDVSCVRDLVKRLVQADESVLMIMHSYGGAVGTDAVEDLEASSRKVAGQQGGVIHLLYLCAYMLAPASTIFGVVEKLGMSSLWSQYMDDAADGTTFPRDPTLWFYGGVDPKTVDTELLPCLVRMPLSALTAQTKGSAWRVIPTTYIFTQEDFAVPRAFQDYMVGQVKEEGVLLRTEDYNTSHSIFITMAQEMVQAAIRAVEDNRNQE